MEIIEKIMARDKFCTETVGIQLIETKPGWAKAKLQIGDKHLNGLGTIQGGAIFTLADFTLATAANSHGTVAVLVNASISYFKAESNGVLYAEAKEESLNNKLATYSIKVTDQKGGLIAMMQATVYRKKDTLESVLERTEPMPS